MKFRPQIVFSGEVHRNRDCSKYEYRTSFFSIKIFSRIFIPDQLAKEKRKIDNLVAVTLLVPEMEKFARINQAYVSYFGINPPVRVCVENSEKLLRLTAIGNDKNEVGTMHVQSISHWAPANIGPYSQATKVCTKK